MKFAELLDVVARLAWQEQVELEYGERHPEVVPEGMAKIDAATQELAAKLTTKQLDALEAHPRGDIVWVLRLSRHVEGDDSHKRARRHIRSRDAAVRYWASKLLASSARKAARPTGATRPLRKPRS